MQKTGRLACPACGSGNCHENPTKEANGQGETQAVHHDARCLDCGEKWKC
jgi:DNA-directed RNA polymerase subunit RPC12/RpoP